VLFSLALALVVPCPSCSFSGACVKQVAAPRILLCRSVAPSGAGPPGPGFAMAFGGKRLPRGGLSLALQLEMANGGSQVRYPANDYFKQRAA
jgi:hypothetical protein